MARLSGRRGLASQPHGVPNRLLKRRLAGQLRHAVDLDVASPDSAHGWNSTTTVVRYSPHGKIAHFAFGDVHHLAHTCPAAGADQRTTPALPTHPHPQGLGPFVDLMLKHAVAGPAQDLGEVVSCTHAVYPTAHAIRITDWRGLYRFLPRARRISEGQSDMLDALCALARDRPMKHVIS
jgi:hypothetical protein